MKWLKMQGLGFLATGERNWEGVGESGADCDSDSDSPTKYFFFLKPSNIHGRWLKQFWLKYQTKSRNIFK